MLARLSAKSLLLNFRGPVKFNARGFASALRDENAPKRPLSAYNIFIKEKAALMRQQSVEKLSGADIIRRCAAEWRAMNPEQKESYSAQVVGMEEYTKEMAAYRKSDTYAAFLKKKALADRREKLKAFELTDAPKRPCSAYIYFSNEMREDVKAANPFATATQMIKLLGAAWKELPEGERGVYERQALDDRTRYDAEMVHHRDSAEYHEMQSKKAEYLNSLKKKKKKPKRMSIDDNARERKKKMAEKAKVKKLKESEKKKLNAKKKNERLEKKRKQKEKLQLERAKAKAKKEKVTMKMKAKKEKDKEKAKLEAEKKKLKIKAAAKKEREVTKQKAAKAKAKAEAMKAKEKAKKLKEKARKFMDKVKKTEGAKKRATATK